MNDTLGIFRVAWMFLSKIDLALLVALIILLTLGGITLHSASGEDLALMNRHLVHLGLAAAAMLIATQLPSHILNQWSIWVYLAGIALLVWVSYKGATGGGAQRWMELGGFRFQPSEIMKIAVPMMVASYFSGRALPPKFYHNLIAAALVLVPMLLIARQPDLGTALLVGSAGFFVIYFAGIAWRWLLAIAIAIAGAAPLLFYYGMEGYQRQRVMTLLDPASDKLGSGYQITQSTIAIGSGGMYGKGWLNGDQSRLDFLPERHTDFIFAIFGEEFGLLGNLLLLSIYLFIIWRGLYLASRGSDTFARLLGGSLSLTFFIYLMVNTGMVSGLLPVVGVPLPLVSYGGTSMVTLMLAFGLLMGLKRRKLGYEAK